MVGEIELKKVENDTEIDPGVSLHIFPSVTNVNSVNTGNAKDFNVTIPRAKTKMIGTTYDLSLICSF